MTRGAYYYAACKFSESCAVGYDALEVEVAALLKGRHSRTVDVIRMDN